MISTNDLKNGYVLDIEGEAGVRIEDLVVLSEDGCEVLSRSPKDLRIVE